MSVTLSPHTEDLIRRLIERGPYADTEAVIKDALALLEEREEQRQRLRAELQSAVEQAERGELIDFTPERFAEIKRRALEIARQGMPIRDAVTP